MLELPGAPVGLLRLSAWPVGGSQHADPWDLERGWTWTQEAGFQPDSMV